MRSSSYKALKVWQKAMDLTVMVYSLVKFLPNEETFGLSDQLRRAVVSIPSNIAEGHGRSTDKEFVHFLSIARGSLYEVETQIEICIRLNFFTSKQCNEVNTLIVEISKMLMALITYRKTRV